MSAASCSTARETERFDLTIIREPAQVLLLLMD
jgi:hypothetical protein